MALSSHKAHAFALAVGVALITTVAIGQTRASTIGVDEIRPGMRGYGLTVFRGTTPERFDVEVIDVLHNFRPDMDLILIKTMHPILDHATVVAGMSGSPIYLEGRLAGAYAYGWPFGKDPVAGVTPIASMLAEMYRPVRPDAFPGAELLPRRRPRRTAAPTAPSRSRLAGLQPFTGQSDRTALDPLEELLERQGRGASDAAVSTTTMQPAATPLMLGGFTDSVARMLGEQLEPFGLVALQAGGGNSSPQRSAAQFVNGGAIGVQLLRGDISATAVGTVTHVEGRRTIAFGHPMMEAGEIGLPTATARVLHILASQARSFKIAEADQPLGTLIHDRQPAIVIDTGVQASTIPVRLRIRGVPGAPRTEWNVEVVEHRVLTPVLTLAAIVNALRATAADQTDVIFTAKSRVRIEGHDPVEVVDIGYMPFGPNDVRALSGLRLFQLMEAAYGNPFVKSRVEGIDLELSLRFARDADEIINVSVAHEEVDPGSRVNLHVELRRYGQPDRVRIVPVDIPAHAAGETIEVRVEAANSVSLENPEPRNLTDLLGIVQNQHPSTAMAVSLKLPTRGLRFAGHVVRELPASALDALLLVSDTERGLPFVTYNRDVIPTGNVMTGAAMLRLRVRETPRQR